MWRSYALLTENCHSFYGGNEVIVPNYRLLFGCSIVKECDNLTNTMKSSKCELCLYRVKLGVLFIIGTAHLEGDYFEFSRQENLYFVQPKHQKL